MHLELFQYFQLLSLLMAIFCYRGLSRFGIAILIPYLIVTNLTEIIGVNYKGSDKFPNYYVYNIYILIYTPLTFLLYSRLLMIRHRERMVYWIIFAACFLFVLYDFIFGEGMHGFDMYSLILTQMLFIVFSCLALVRLLMQDREVIFLREPWFWISASNLLFGLILVLLLGLQEYISTNKVMIGNDTLYHFILPKANIVLYSVYTFAFILCRIRTAT
jgi:hypothetical protein